MADDLILPPEPPRTGPVCPYCGQDPAVIALNGPYLLSGLHILIVHCGNAECRRIWTADVRKEQPRLHIPS